MPTPAHKGLRDYENPINDYSFTTITIANTTLNTTTISTSTFTHSLGTGDSTLTATTNVTTSTTPTTSVVPTFTRSSVTRTQTLCLTCSPSARTSATNVGTSGQVYTFTQETWRSIEDSEGQKLDTAIPWQPIGVGGLAKWYMADKGDPSFGVKKDIHALQDEDAEYKGSLEPNGILESGIRPQIYENFFKNGKFLNDTISNEQFVGQGMEGFISGSFIFRYNIQNPNDRLFEPYLNKITQEVDGVAIPTGWIRVKIRGVQVNNSGQIVAIAVVTKYGAGDNASYALRENYYEDGAWTGNKSVLREKPSPKSGFEGHAEVINLSNFWDHSDKQIFHFFDNPKSSSLDEDAIASNLPSNIPSNFTYPLTIVAGEELQYARSKYANQVRFNRKNVLNAGFPPDAPRVNFDEELIKAKKLYNSLGSRLNRLPYNDPTEDSSPLSKPSDEKDYVLHDLLPHIFRISSDAGVDVQYSEDVFPYKKTFLINGVEVEPKIRLTKYSYLMSPQEREQAKGYDDQYLHVPVQRERNRVVRLLDWVVENYIARDRWTFSPHALKTTFGKQSDNYIDPMLKGFNHDVLSLSQVMHEENREGVWTEISQSTGTFNIVGIKDPLNGYQIKVEGVGETTDVPIDISKGLYDKAIHKNTPTRHDVRQDFVNDNILVLEFLTS